MLYCFVMCDCFVLFIRFSNMLVVYLLLYLIKIIIRILECVRFIEYCEGFLLIYVFKILFFE